MALRKNAFANAHLDRIQVNVYDITTKQIIFTGYKVEAAKFLGITTVLLRHALKNKGKIKKKFAVRHVPINPQQKSK